MRIPGLTPFLLQAAPSSAGAPWLNPLFSFWIVNFIAVVCIVLFALRYSLRNIPANVLEAARLDGCGFWHICWHVLLPRALPALTIGAVLILIFAWDDIGPLLAEPAGLGAGLLAARLHPGILMAVSLLLVLPVATTLVFASRVLGRRDAPPPPRPTLG